MKKYLIFILAFISCVNYHDDFELIILEVPLSEKVLIKEPEPEPQPELEPKPESETFSTTEEETQEETTTEETEDETTTEGESTTEETEETQEETTTEEPKPVLYTLKIIAGSGGVVSNEGGEYEEGTELEVIATPDEGWKFVQWMGELNSTENPLTFTLDWDLTFYAIFDTIIPVEPPPTEETQPETPTTEEETTTEETQEEPQEEPATEEPEEELTETEFVNLQTHWNRGEPTGNQPYVFMISDTGKWVDHNETLNNDGYGLYQISRPISEIPSQQYSDYDDFIFLGELNGITYFFSKNIMAANVYVESRPLNGEGRPVILDSEKKINFIVTSHSEYPLKALWIGLRKVNGEWQWIRN